MPIEVVWLGHAGVMIRFKARVLYIDPWKVGRSFPQADIILLTHDHYDHYSPEDIALLKRGATRVAAPMPVPEVTDVIRPGERLILGDVVVDAVPAYNITKGFHPRANDWLGYVIQIDGRKIYHAGDTDRIPEMDGLNADLALIPVGGTYTMDARDAALAAEDINAGVTIPIHFGDIVGTREDADRFARSCSRPVHVLDPGESYILS